MKLSVHIVETSHPKDFYSEALDGVAARHILNTMGIRNRFRMALDTPYLKKAVTEAVSENYRILHLSCHGDETGIAVTVGSELSWKQFASLFPDEGTAPALVMSCCKGAVDGISKAFANRSSRPPFIFGSEDKLYYDDYVTAWSILYRRLHNDGLSKSVGQQALEEICAVVHESFRYWRWDAEREAYLRYPGLSKCASAKRGSEASPVRLHGGVKRRARHASPAAFA